MPTDARPTFGDGPAGCDNIVFVALCRRTKSLIGGDLTLSTAWRRNRIRANKRVGTLDHVRHGVAGWRTMAYSLALQTDGNLLTAVHCHQRRSAGPAVARLNAAEPSKPDSVWTGWREQFRMPWVAGGWEMLSGLFHLVTVRSGIDCATARDGRSIVAGGADGPKGVVKHCRCKLTEVVIGVISHRQLVAGGKMRAESGRDLAPIGNGDGREIRVLRNGKPDGKPLIGAFTTFHGMERGDSRGCLATGPKAHTSLTNGDADKRHRSGGQRLRLAHSHGLAQWECV